MELTMVVCEERAGPTPIHLEPGRETAQRRGYWGVPWETRSVHHFQLSKQAKHYAWLVCFNSIVLFVLLES